MRNKLFLMIISIFVAISAFQTTALPVAAATKYLYVGKSPVSKLTLYVGEKNTRLRYNINGKKSGISGKWKSSDKDVVRVSSKGSCKAVGNGSATVSFTYKEGGKSRTLKCVVSTKTKAGSISLYNESGSGDAVELTVSASHSFTSEITPPEKALEINEDIESTFLSFYGVYSDEACTTISALGTISGDGVFTAGTASGIVYVRAEAKESGSSASGAVSNVIKVSIKKEDTVKKPDSTETGNMVKPSRIEISGIAPLTTIAAINGLYTAEAFFKVYDSKGNDITASSDLKLNNYTVTWQPKYPPVNGQNLTFDPQKQNVSEAGKINLLLLGTVSGINIYAAGITGELKISYKISDTEELTVVRSINIGMPSMIMSAEVKGIYKCNVTMGGIVYEPVLNKDFVTLKQGDVIADFGGSHYLNSVYGSYYLLIKATDTYGNTVSSLGTAADRLRLSVTGSTTAGNPGIELATVRNSSGQQVYESVKPIVIDGVSYLTYPLKAVTVRQGEINILSVSGMFKQSVTDGTTLKMFFLTGSAGGDIKVGKDNLMGYMLYNSKYESVRDYNTVIRLLGLTDLSNSGNIVLGSDSKVISSEKGATFIIKRNASTGEAEIFYAPYPNFTMIGNVMQNYFNDNITVLKGYGADYEKVIPVVVTR